MGAFRLSRRAAAVVTAGALMAFQALAIVGSGSVSAAPTCSFSPLTNTVDVTIDAYNTGTMTVDGATDAIELDGAQCDTATTSNTTQIVVTGAAGNEWLVIQNDAEDPFPSTISWDVDLGAGHDGIELWMTHGSDSVSVTDTGFTMNGATGTFSEVEQVSVWGLQGADTISGSALSVTGPVLLVDAHEGDDVVAGGSGRDNLQGGEDDDVVAAGSQDDYLRGGGGDDVLDGGKGNDQVFAGGGDDRARGSAGWDWLYGRDGNDKLFGGGGIDVGQGGKGDDVCKYIELKSSC